MFRECSGKELYSKVGCEALFRKLAANGVWQTPTMAFFQMTVVLANLRRYANQCPSGERSLFR